jgi:hypothetical protein
MLLQLFGTFPPREMAFQRPLISHNQQAQHPVQLSNPKAPSVHFSGKPYQQSLPPIQDSRSPEAVLGTLTQAMDNIAPCYALTQSGGWLYGIQRGEKPVTGERNGNVIRVMRWLKINNPHTPILEITVKPNGTGSLLESRFVRLASTEKWMNRLWPLSWPIDQLGSWLAKRDEPKLEAWLKNTLQSDP